MAQSVRTRFRASTLAVLAGLIAPFLVGAASPAGTPAAAQPAVVSLPASPTVPQLHWTACGGALQCATASVPLDYNHPRGSKISLALIRLPASDPAHKIGSIFVNPGGPGGSGIDEVRSAGHALFSTAVRARFDVVGFDPRGVGLSSPLRCFDTSDQANAVLPPFPFPVTRHDERVQVRSDRALARACTQHSSAILDHMATADVARDMDLLRRAVGDRGLTYYGVSYGSYLGTTYANMFPNKVRALVVDGVLDPIAWATGRGDQARSVPFSTRLHSDQGADVTLQEFFRLCKAGGARCPFSQGNPAARYRALARRLRAHPAELPDGAGGTFTYTYANLVSDTLGSLYDPSSWPDLADVLQQIDTMTAPRTAATALHALRTRLGAYQEKYPNFVESFPAVACSDSDNPSRVAAWPRAAETADRAHPYFGRLWTWASSICQSWPGHDADRYTGPFNKVTANPVLVIGNRFDPATRYQGAVTVANLLPRSRLLTLDGWGHTSLFKSACIHGYLDRYLLRKQLPAPGTVCQPDVVPFALSAASSRASEGPSTRSVGVSPLARWAVKP